MPGTAGRRRAGGAPVSDQLFACPQCRGPLALEEGRYRCPPCGRKWDVVNGIPSFTEQDSYWNHLPREKMARLLQTGREQGYRRALEAHLPRESSLHSLDYVLDERRAGFRVLLPLTRESTVLDMGCGWGAVTTALARTCRLVVGADATRETLEFVALRADEEGLSNLQLAHIDPLDFGRLPFPDGSFDVVVMNGVLEWIGKVRLAERVPALQRAALQEVRRVLKPQGILYVGIENRYSILYWAGQRDHYGLRFTSLLPRWASDLISRSLRGEPYRTYTYSRRGCQALLSGAGFGSVRFYLPLPTYHKPHFLLPFDDYRPLRYLLHHILVRGNSPSRKRAVALRLARLFCPLRVHSLLCPSFSVVARASP